MKKRVGIFIAILVALLLVYIIGSGFLKSGNIEIQNYTISNDGKEITLDIGNDASSGYVRKATIYQQQGGKLYIDFYYTFGGINSIVGAKTQFTLPLEDDTTIIAVYRDTNAYEKALQKDSNGIWQ